MSSDLLNGAGGVPLDDAAKILGLSRRTIERRLAQGSLQGRRDGKRWLVILPESKPDNSDTVRSERDKLSCDLSELSAKYDSLTQERDTLSRQAANARADLEDRLKALESERDRLSEQVAELSQECDRITTERDTLAVKVSELSIERDRLATECGNLTRQVSELDRRAGDLERDRERWQQMAAMESSNLKAALEVRGLLATTTEEGRRWWWQVWRR